VRSALGPIDRTLDRFAKSRAGSWAILNVFTHLDRWLMRASKGRFSSMVGTPLHHQSLVLTTRGAKSGKERNVPLVYLRRGSNIIVIASATGQKEHPAWYLNLKAHPEATVHVGGRAIPVTAKEAEGKERDDLYEEAVRFYSGFDIYRRRTERTIPVMVLSPR
jgi:F420H(2)-dependent quinone reductase